MKDEWLELLNDEEKAIDTKIKRKYDTKAKVERSIKRQVKEIKDVDSLLRLEMEKKIYLLVLDGWTNKRIVDELMLNYGFSENAAWTLIKGLNRSYIPKAKIEVDELRGMYIEMYADLYKRSVEKKDYATARNILDSIIKLQGLAIQKIEAKVENVYNIEF